MLIGLNGRAGSGKDTAYHYISESGLLQNVRRESFADRLKVSAARALGFDGTWDECVDFCNQVKDQSVGITTSMPGRCLSAVSGREFLQRYGTEAHRDLFGVDFWTDACLPSDFVHTDETVIVTDVRFANEARRIKALGGYVWRIERPFIQITESGHSSEQPLPEELVDLTIINDNSLADFRHAVEGVLRTLHQYSL